ncbi:MAG: DUF4855 domain-containing protein [Bacteroides sp.]|nr:DUF4855 domain-containing protein [Bacteroides sp.]
MAKRILSVLAAAGMMFPAIVAGRGKSNAVDKAADASSVGIVAHRGYWNCEDGGHARNSLAAFKAAHHAGFWGTEFDVNMTADGQLLVFHDETIGGKRIDHSLHSDFADYRLENGEPIPTVDQFLEYASSQPDFPMLVFELKGHITEELQDRAVATSIEKLKKYGMFSPDKVMFISFHIRQCRLLAEAAPGFTVQYLNVNVDFEDLLDNMVNGIDLYFEHLLGEPMWLKRAREHGFSVNTWTVNKAEDMRRVLALGIDQLTTDCPDVARKVLSEDGVPELLPGEMKHPEALPAKKDPKLKKLSASDYVLVYAGGGHSKYYDEDWMQELVSYVDRDGKEHWLFDGFLFLQIMDRVERVAFDPGHRDENGIFPAAVQADWLKLIDYYFEKDACLDALDKAVDKTAGRIGDPGYKRQVIISVPNPIRYRNPGSRTGGTTYWGVLDGKVTDFDKEEDRLAACRWYIDEVLKRFKSARYRNIELAGFYYVTEETTDSGNLIEGISGYVHSKGYPLTWIPYYNAPGWNLWKEKNFDFAWYQPNYFFNPWLPEERLEKACRRALNYGMAMEMEFDERAVAVRPDGQPSMGGRLRGYMDAYRKYGSWEKLPIAYYVSSRGVHVLKESENQQDRDLYYDFCDFVAKRPLRKKMLKENR